MKFAYHMFMTFLFWGLFVALSITCFYIAINPEIMPGFTPSQARTIFAVLGILFSVFLLYGLKSVKSNDEDLMRIFVEILNIAVIIIATAEVLLFFAYVEIHGFFALLLSIIISYINLRGFIYYSNKALLLKKAMVDLFVWKNEIYLKLKLKSLIERYDDSIIEEWKNQTEFEHMSNVLKIEKISQGVNAVLQKTIELQNSISLDKALTDQLKDFKSYTKRIRSIYRMVGN